MEGREQGINLIMRHRLAALDFSNAKQAEITERLERVRSLGGEATALALEVGANDFAEMTDEACGRLNRMYDDIESL